MRICYDQGGEFGVGDILIAKFRMGGRRVEFLVLQNKKLLDLDSLEVFDFQYTNHKMGHELLNAEYTLFDIMSIVPADELYIGHGY